MRRSIICLFLFVFIVASACNFPVKTAVPVPTPTNTPGPDWINPQDTPVLVTAAAGTAIPPTEQAPLEGDPSGYISYTAQSGDTLKAVAAHFGVEPSAISSKQPIPSSGLIPNHQVLVIPQSEIDAPYSQTLLPDSDIVNSPCGRNFDIQGYIKNGNGKLASYTQYVEPRTLSGADIVRLVSRETSINPRVLLAFIEFRSKWVSSSPAVYDPAYPLNLSITGYEGLYLELALTAKLLNMGYYPWRGGTLTELPFSDGSTLRISPGLNAGSVALQYLFARIYLRSDWQTALYGTEGFLATYEKMFGDTESCAETIGPLFPDGLQPPTLELPFTPGEDWVLTGGLHSDWNTGTPSGALDFAPITGESHCAVSRAWVLASAPGIVSWSENGVLQEDLVDDSGQPTGWELLYMHVADQDRPGEGTHLKTNDPIGHPSCEGGIVTGSHVHLARAYRGEWIGAGDPFPYTLSGWLAVPGNQSYQSTLVKGDQVVVAHPDGSGDSKIVR